MTRYRYDMDEFLLCDEQPMGSQDIIDALEERDQLRNELELIEAERDDLRAKMDAIGELCPTHYEDRDELLRAPLRIRRGEIPEQEEA